MGEEREGAATQSPSVSAAAVQTPRWRGIRGRLCHRDTGDQTRQPIVSVYFPCRFIHRYDLSGVCRYDCARSAMASPRVCWVIVCGLRLRGRVCRVTRGTLHGVYGSTESKEEINQVLNGVTFHFNAARISLHACNGHNKGYLWLDCYIWRH